MNYQLTQHAQDALVKRKISLEWIKKTMENPTKIISDRVDKNLEHRLVIIPEYENRVFRVIVNVTVDPMKIVTFYFDRKMKGKL